MAYNVAIVQIKRKTSYSENCELEQASIPRIDELDSDGIIRFIVTTDMSIAKQMPYFIG